MPYKTKTVEIIENLENQIVAHVISNTLNEMNTIGGSSDSTNNIASIESDDEALQIPTISTILQILNL
jgi:hypothetical protein